MFSRKRSAQVIAAAVLAVSLAACSQGTGTPAPAAFEGIGAGKYTTLGSDFDGANADGKAYRAKFTGKYEHRVFAGVGHDVPQEASAAFTQAVVDAGHL